MTASGQTGADNAAAKRAAVRRAERRRRTPFLKRFLPRTLFGRSLLIIVTPVILAQAVATWIFYDRHWDTVTNRLAYGVAGDIATVIAVLEHDPTPEGRDWTLATAARTTDLIVTLEPGQSCRSSVASKAACSAACWNARWARRWMSGSAAPSR